MRFAKYLPALLIAGLAGCFPIDLDMNARGDMLIPRQEGFFLYSPSTGQTKLFHDASDGLPAFARFSPNGTDALLVSEVKEDFSTAMRFALAPLAGGPTRELFKMKQPAAAHFSPDASKLAVVRIGDFSDDQMPEIHLADVKAGGAKLLLKKTGHTIRWFADSKRLLMVKVLDKDKETRLLTAQLTILDVDGGKETPLANVIADNITWSLDLSPDNSRVLFTAMKAAPADEKIAAPKENEERKTLLFDLNLADKKLRPTGIQAQLVRFSPTGKRVLLTNPGEGYGLEEMVISIASAGLTDVTPVEKKAYNPMIYYGGGLNLPNFIDDQTIWYLQKKMIFGTAGTAVHMTILNLERMAGRDAQPELDLGVLRELDRAAKLR